MSDAQAPRPGDAGTAARPASVPPPPASVPPPPTPVPPPPPPPAPVPVPALVNVANVLTVLRIFLVPVFVVCLVHGGTEWRLAALAAFFVASVTDFLDGQLARNRGLVTDFGKIADPIADKALTGAALITLSALGELAAWVTALILVREVGITVLRFAVIRRGVIAASQGGKLKTMLQIVAICLYVLPASLGLPALVKEVVMAAALVVTLVTGADYVIRATRMVRSPAASARVPSAGPHPGSGGPEERRHPLPDVHGDLASRRRTRTWQTRWRAPRLAAVREWPRASWRPRSSRC